MQGLFSYYSDRLLATSCAAVVPLVLGAVLSQFAVPGEDLPPTFRTLMMGWQHRADMVQSFEGYLVTKVFYGPGHERAAGAESREARDWAELRFYAYVNGPTGRRWLREVRKLSKQDTTRYHSVFAFRDGIRAIRWLSSPVWAASYMPEVSDPMVGALGSDLLVRGPSAAVISDHVEDISVAEEEVDGAPCLRCRLAYRETKEGTAVVYLWVDPALGFAIRRTATVLALRGECRRAMIKRGGDFQEYSAGLWLPRRVEGLNAVSPEGQERWLWDELRVREVISAKVNEPLSEYVQRILESLVFEDEVAEIPYEPMIADDRTVEMDRNGSQKATRKEVRLKAIIDHVLEQLEAGPADPVGFMELLPQLPELSLQQKDVP